VDRVYLQKAWTEIVLKIYFKGLQLCIQKFTLSDSLLLKINIHRNLHKMPQMMFSFWFSIAKVKN